jgi:hypothetical protein
VVRGWPAAAGPLGFRRATGPGRGRYRARWPVRAALEHDRQVAVQERPFVGDVDSDRVIQGADGHADRACAVPARVVDEDVEDLTQGRAQTRHAGCRRPLAAVACPERPGPGATAGGCHSGLPRRPAIPSARGYPLPGPGVRRWSLPAGRWWPARPHRGPQVHVRLIQRGFQLQTQPGQRGPQLGGKHRRRIPVRGSPGRGLALDVEGPDGTPPFLVRWEVRPSVCNIDHGGGTVPGWSGAPAIPAGTAAVLIQACPRAG